jgi:hypothetical protein
VKKLGKERFVATLRNEMCRREGLVRKVRR